MRRARARERVARPNAFSASVCSQVLMVGSLADAHGSGHRASRPLPGAAARPS